MSQHEQENGELLAEPREAHRYILISFYLQAKCFAVTVVTDRCLKRQVTSCTTMLYAPGESVLITGCYEAMHMGHRPPHQVWLFFNEKFPCCKQCGSGVIFKFVRRATEPMCDHANADEDFSGGSTAA